MREALRIRAIQIQHFEKRFQMNSEYRENFNVSSSYDQT